MRLLLIAMLIALAGCAGKRPTQAMKYSPDHKMVTLQHAIWKDCIMRGSDQVTCRCATFTVSIDAKTKATVLSCQ